MSSLFTALFTTAIGLISSTTFATMNLVLDHIAVPSLLHEHQPSTKPWESGPSSTSSEFSSGRTRKSFVPALRSWSIIQHRGHFIGPASAIISTAAYLSASCCVADSPTKAVLRFAAACAFSVMPYTVICILKLNDELNARAARPIAHAKSGGSGNGLASSTSDGNVGDMDQLRKWTKMNDVRAILAVLATVSGMAGLWNMLSQV